MLKQRPCSYHLLDELEILNAPPCREPDRSTSIAWQLTRDGLLSSHGKSRWCAVMTTRWSGGDKMAPAAPACMHGHLFCGTVCRDGHGHSHVIFADGRLTRVMVNLRLIPCSVLTCRVPSWRVFAYFQSLAQVSLIPLTISTFTEYRVHCAVPVWNRYSC